jgi:hypothetical protein
VDLEVAVDGGSVVVTSFIDAAFAGRLDRAGRIGRPPGSDKKPIVTSEGEADTSSLGSECSFLTVHS